MARDATSSLSPSGLSKHAEAYLNKVELAESMINEKLQDSDDTDTLDPGDKTKLSLKSKETRSSVNLTGSLLWTIELNLLLYRLQLRNR